MGNYILRRVLATIPVLFMVAVIVFAILRLSPGDPAAILAGDVATTEQIEEIRKHLGLDRPLLEQFVFWTTDIMRGDFGTSFHSRQPVGRLINQRMEATIALAMTTLIFAVLISVPLGVVAAWQRGRITDRLVMSFSVLGFSIPVFVLGYLLCYIVAIWLDVLPVQGYKPIANGFWPFIERLILPTLTLSGIYIALIARITRTSMLEVLNEDYIRTARAKGLSEIRVMIIHALRNAAIPIVTVIGIGVALLISGVVITETVFNLPGLGRLTVDAVLSQDYPIIQSLILLFSFVYVAVNLIVDLLYILLDPRIRY